MIKIKLEGLPSEVQAAADQIGQQFDILEQSDLYANRGGSKFVRMYLTLDMKKNWWEEQK